MSQDRRDRTQTRTSDSPVWFAKSCGKEAISYKVPEFLQASSDSFVESLFVENLYSKPLTTNEDNASA